MKILVKESYLARIDGLVGVTMFRNLYALVDGKSQDILDNGDRSCALVVSTVLVGFRLVQAVHATVSATIADMEASGWKRISKPRAGCVVVWDVNTNGRAHQHIGFYRRPGLAISNNSETGVPKQHPYQAYPIAALYWHAKLE